LVKNKQIKRHRLHGLALYTSIDSEIAENQIAIRREKIKSRLRVPDVPSIEMTIAVLVEALRAGKALTLPSTVSARLTAQGMVITADKVEQIFSQYNLQAEKKTVDQP
jgi:hypothetical protein